MLAGVLLRHPDTPLLGPETVAGPLPAPPESRDRPGEPAPEGLLPMLELRRLAAAREALERFLILRALARAAGSRARAARELGISRQGLWQKLRRYGIR